MSSKNLFKTAWSKYNTLDFTCRQAETTRLYRAVIPNINGVDIYPTEAEALTKAPFLLLKGEVQAEKKWLPLCKSFLLQARYTLLSVCFYLPTICYQNLDAAINRNEEINNGACRRNRRFFSQAV